MAEAANPCVREREREGEKRPGKLVDGEDVLGRPFIGLETTRIDGERRVAGVNDGELVISCNARHKGRKPSIDRGERKSSRRALHFACRCVGSARRRGDRGAAFEAAAAALLSVEEDEQVLGRATELGRW